MHELLFQASKVNNAMMILSDLFADADFVASVPYTKETFKPDAIILDEEEDSQDVYFIMQGNVRVSTALKDKAGGHKQLVTGLARLQAGDYFGEMAMFDGEPRSARVTAETECLIAKVDGAAMIAFMDKHPEKGYFLLRDMFMNQVLRMRQNNLRTNTVLGLYLQEQEVG